MMTQEYSRYRVGTKKNTLTSTSNGHGLFKGSCQRGESNYEGIQKLKEETQIELPNKADYLHETTNKTGSTLHIYFYKSAEALKPHINSEHIGWAYFSVILYQIILILG